MNVRDLVTALCSDVCAGRRTGTAGGREARRLIVDALRDVGLDPSEQPIAGNGGANVLATVQSAGGESDDRWVIVAAHYDHLGVSGRDVYRGADDNAAAVGILVAVARALAATRPEGRNVLIAAFDAEEPPYFAGPTMGSEHWVRSPTIALDRVDLMICMDLVGHALGPAGMPAVVRDTVFALGAERSEGTSALLDSVAAVEPGVVVRRADAEIIDPLSDHASFWSRQIPFLFLSNGRSRVYHTPEDTADKLDWQKMGATARWLDRFVRIVCARPERRCEFRERRDDASTLRTFLAITDPLRAMSAEARLGHDLARTLLAACDADGRLLREDERLTMQGLANHLETALG